MLELLPPLNDKNLPWLDVIHPIIVHFVIAMALITVVFDVLGVITRRRNLFEVSFWNLDAVFELNNVNMEVEVDQGLPMSCGRSGG